MKSMLLRAGRWLMQFVAGFVILLALLVGIARLLLPEASEFKEDIRSAVERETGFTVDFDLISAGLSLYGPELRLVGTSIRWPDQSEVVAVEALAISLDLIELLLNRRLLPGHIFIRGTSVDVEVSADGELFLQGHNWKDYLLVERREGMEEIPDIRVELADIGFSFRNLQRNGPRIDGVIKSFAAIARDGLVQVTANADPGSDYGKTLEVEATLPLALLMPDQSVGSETGWELRLSADDFRLYKWLDVAEFRDLPVVDSEGSAALSARLLGTVPQEVTAELDLAALQLAQPGAAPVLIDALEGRFHWSQMEGGWQADGEDLRIERLSRTWPRSNFRVSYTKGPAQDEEQISASASFVRVEDLLPFVRALAPDQLKSSGFLGEPFGDLEAFELDLQLQAGKPGVFSLASVFNRAGYSAGQQGIEVTGFSGRISADDGGGNLELNTRDARFGLDSLFRDVLDIAELDGLAIWRSSPEGHRLLADGITLKTSEGAASASLELSVDEDFANPVIDLTAQANLEDVAAVWRYLPRVIPAPVLSWLDSALIGGRVTDADFRLQGPLGEFPYDHDEGVFVIGVNFADGVLNYAPDWPIIENASGRLVFDGVSMYSTENAFSLRGMKLEDISVRFEDMRTGLLRFAGAGDIRVEDLLGFVHESPVSEKLGPVFADVEAFGAGRVTMQIALPVKEISAWRLAGKLTVANAEVGLKGIDETFTNLNGTGSIMNTQISAAGVTGKLLDRPVVIDVEPVQDSKSAYSHRAFVKGRLPVVGIEQALNLPLVPSLEGEAELTAQAMFPGGAGGTEPFSLFIRSDLEGVSSGLPYPLGKSEDGKDSLQMEVRFPDRGVAHIFGSLNRGLSWALAATNEADQWSLDRGSIVRDREIPALPNEPLLTLSGTIDSIDLADWVNMMSASSDGATEGSGASLAGWQRLFREADLHVGELFAVGYRFVDLDLDVKFGETAWLIEMSGPWADGTLVVPYDFTGNTPLMVDMERLLLIEEAVGEGDAEAADDPLDPRTLPAIRGTVNDFALGSMRLGQLNADVRRVDDGLRSSSLQTLADSFSTEMSYDWVVVDNAQRSRLHMVLESRNVADTLKKLGYSPLMEAEKGSVTADLLWEGGPGMNSVYASTGTVELSIKNGIVNDVDTGTGRILGLLSVTRLPQRLSLDFREITEEGLEFDKIAGRFRIDFGDAWTCNLGLEGPVADMGIVGRAGILAEDYDQVAAMRPHVSNLAPVAGAFLAGPTVGIATLLVTQIMKKPLSSIGETYYTILGDWDDPKFTRVDRDKLNTRPFADCEQQLPPLSPEEIQAIEELIANSQALLPELAPDAEPQAPPGGDD
jgi:uncharacterized protein (TIGR02099 family)